MKLNGILFNKQIDPVDEQGDTYFKIHREGQNLDRCRTQFKLVADMETKWETMAEIVKKYNV